MVSQFSLNKVVLWLPPMQVATGSHPHACAYLKTKGFWIFEILWNTVTWCSSTFDHLARHENELRGWEEKYAFPCSVLARSVQLLSLWKGKSKRATVKWRVVLSPITITCSLNHIALVTMTRLLRLSFTLLQFSSCSVQVDSGMQSKDW